MKKLLIIPLVIILATALFLGSCGEAAPGGPTEIRIGSSAPMTGMFGGFGEGCTFGMQAAFDDINAQGGLYIEEYGKKIPVKLVIANNESDPVKSGTLAEDLIVNSQVYALISPDEPCSMHNPISTVADRYQIPHIIGGGPLEPWAGARAEVEGHWAYTWLPGFGIATPPVEGDFRYGEPGYTIRDTWFAELEAHADQTNKVAGVFATDEPDGRGWYGLFPGLLEEFGLTVVGAEKNLGLVPVGTTDFSSLIQEWKDNNVEILWGNAPGPGFGTMWKQARALGFSPKIVSIGRAPLFYVDITSWGGDLPLGIGTEIWWAPEYDAAGIGDTTPQSLAARWTAAKNEPLNRGIGHGYAPAQVMLDAMERAGTLDGAAINQAIAETDLETINYRVKFNQEMHFSWIPLFFGQWQKTDLPHVWECPIVFSKHDFLPAQGTLIFPIPYD